MILTLIRHELKAFWRSKGAGKAVAIKVVMGILLFFLFLEVMALAIFWDYALHKFAPQKNTTTVFLSIIFYYFLFDLLLRFLLQELPTLKVQPYLHLAIKKNTLIRYLSITALRSFFNLWPFILFTPFIIKVICHNQGVFTGLLFFTSIIAIACFNNYFSLYIKRKSNLNGWIALVYVVALGLLIAADLKWDYISISQPSYWFFGHLHVLPWLALFPLVLAFGMYQLNFYYLKGNLYLEELKAKKAESYKNSTEYPILDRLGSVGDLVANEIKLILRNKRPRSSLIVTCVFLLYGLLFYSGKIKVYSGDGWKVFCGQFMTGLFIMNYGQFMYGWQGSHFDGILVSKVKFADFLKAKYLLFTAVGTLAFIATTPYAYFGLHIVWVNFIMFLWNIGITTTVVLFFANRNYKRVDLGKSASFNWEGVSATQMLMSFPLMIAPFVVYGPLALFHHPDIALGILGGIGILFVLMRPYWIKKLEADFNEKRYTIAEGFRNK